MPFLPIDHQKLGLAEKLLTPLFFTNSGCFFHSDSRYSFGMHSEPRSRMRRHFFSQFESQFRDQDESLAKVWTTIRTLLQGQNWGVLSCTVMTFLFLAQTFRANFYCLSPKGEPAFMAGPKPMQTEFGIHQRLESCDHFRICKNGTLA